MTPRVLVVIPAYNEAASIAEVASRASAHADVCVVDDASTDGTREILGSLQAEGVIRRAGEPQFRGIVGARKLKP